MREPKRGATVIIDRDGFKYNKHKELATGGEKWRCSKRISQKCGVKLFIMGDSIQLIDGPHFHDP